MTARVLTAILAVLFVVLAFDAGAAHAQGAVAPVDAKIGPAPDFDPPRSATTAGKTVSKRDSVASPAPGAPTNAAAKRTKGGMAFAFWGFAALTVLGSLFVITRRNLITAVMGMVGTFFALAALYMLLYAHFLAIIQMLVYAGAIMVLFVFVIMILNKPEDEPFALSGRVGKVLAGLAMAYLVFRIGSVLIDVPAHVTMAQNAAPARTAAGDDWGSTAAVGMNLFNDYLFPFEAVSLTLLIAVVGAIAIARPLKDDEPAAEAATPGGH
jgi:NADH-quinone oxidoreductase subunit J